MKKTFIESSRFTNEVGKLLDDDSFYALQNELMQDPERGAVMPGCGDCESSEPQILESGAANEAARA